MYRDENIEYYETSSNTMTTTTTLAGGGEEGGDDHDDEEDGKSTNNNYDNDDRCPGTFDFVDAIVDIGEGEDGGRDNIEDDIEDGRDDDDDHDMISITTASMETKSMRWQSRRDVEDEYYNHDDIDEYDHDIDDMDDNGNKDDGGDDGATMIAGNDDKNAEGADYPPSRLTIPKSWDDDEDATGKGEGEEKDDDDDDVNHDNIDIGEKDQNDNDVISTNTVSAETKLMQWRSQRRDNNVDGDDDDEFNEDEDKRDHIIIDKVERVKDEVDDQDDHDDDDDDEVVEVVKGRLLFASEMNERQRYHAMAGSLGTFGGMPSSHKPTWGEILPKSMCKRHDDRDIMYRGMVPPPPHHVAQQRHMQMQQHQQKRIILSLINVWEFTITIEPLYGSGTFGDYNNYHHHNAYSSSSSSSYYHGNNGHFGGYSGMNNNPMGAGYAIGNYPHSYNHSSSGSINSSNNNNNNNDIINANNNINATSIRAQIKKIARNCIGRDGRRGAVYERGGIESLSDEPALRDEGSSDVDFGTESNSVGRGKWRIPLGAYHPLMTYLTSTTTTSPFGGNGRNVVEGIPPEQLRMASLGRERMDKSTHATVEELITRNVHPAVARALAPYQRSGVEFVLDRGGRALLADEMGLGKTVQAIAAMSAYAREDWPLLVLCPSTARYHWEVEFRHWLGTGSMERMAAEADVTEVGDGGTVREVVDDVDRRGGLDVDVIPSSGGDVAPHPARPTTVMQDATIKGGSLAFLEKGHINVLTSGRDTILKSDGSTRVVICSIGLIVNLVASGRIRPGMFRAIVVDESHALKNKDAKRTKVVLPLLSSARRCLLLSGTPAFAKPSELWPQLSVLRNRSASGWSHCGGNESSSGIWCDEEEFMSKYVKGKVEEGNKTRYVSLAFEWMKADILKNLPSKIREKAFINVEDENLRNEFIKYMQQLREGRGVLGKLARVHHQEDTSRAESDTCVDTEDNYPQPVKGSVLRNREVLHYLYKISGRSKIHRITLMLRHWLADNTKGKLCIFAHHLEVLDEISGGAGLSNAIGSTTKFIRIDGSTSPKSRQEQILQFQTDPKIRIAILGITAAGVAVTLTASSTVWFAELFWTPAIMIQAEDRCHRIGQQARVRCLYFIGKGTLDEVLWKLIEKKFRALGEFVEGKEDMGIALERELEDGEHEEILKSEDIVNDGDGKKRKLQDVFYELLETDDPELKNEIDELCHEEEDMLKIKNDDEGDEPDAEENMASAASNANTVTSNKEVAPAATSASIEAVIELSDDDDVEEVEVKPLTFADMQNRYRRNGTIAELKIDPQMPLRSLRLYTVNYPGPHYGLIMVSCNVLQLMRAMMRTPPVSVIFADDNEFAAMFLEDFMPILLLRSTTTPSSAIQQPAPASSCPGALTTTSTETPYELTHINRPPIHATHKSEVIDLLDDD
ncbi:hypothetical protein ACHAXA_009891 [Cyclostephanos tholiformis]|uniref:Uncharacterized protein n=1 Tax=Cyclostephanos tholiformis TaxID=382380 RepID=A0ABD3RW71_9STRA